MKELQIFSNQEFGDVRAVEVNGKPYAIGVDVARALGYAYPNQAVGDHCKGIVKLPIPSQNQFGATVIQETNVIPEGDIYRLIVKAADQSRNPSIKVRAERFERWVFDDVLPTVRKHGAYIEPAKLEEILNDPDAWIKVLTALKEERDAKEQLQIKAIENQPKVVFADAVSVSDGAILIGELAKILKGNGIEIGQNRLFEQLRLDGYLIKRRGTDYNAPTQRAMELGLFKVKETAITHSDGHVTISKTTKVTGKGQQYFINLFLRERGRYVQR